MGLYGTNQGDDGYQGPQAASTLTAREQEMVNLTFQISQLDELAWGYEDREQLSKVDRAAFAAAWEALVETAELAEVRS